MRNGRGPKKWSERDLLKLEESARLLIQAIGDDPAREGLVDTPRRFRDAWVEMTTPPRKPVAAFDSPPTGGLIVVQGIRAWSICEHHLMPFSVEAAIGVLPARRVLGLSKYARVVDDASRRLQIQERLTNDVAEAIIDGCDPRGVAVVIRGGHLCMCARGVRQHGAEMTTVAWRGEFLEGDVALSLRSEFFAQTSR